MIDTRKHGMKEVQKLTLCWEAATLSSLESNYLVKAKISNDDDDRQKNDDHDKNNNDDDNNYGNDNENKNKDDNEGEHDNNDDG